MIARIVIIIAGILLSTNTKGQSIKEEVILLKNKDIELPGTLSYKLDNEKQPLVIFVPGSGNPDRNGNQLSVGIKANYIKLLAQSLNTQGIAIFRYDKRSATTKNIPVMLKSFKFNELASDVRCILDHFKEDERFSKIILIGHSQGSLVSMLAINDYVDKYVSVAGLGTTFEKAIIRQFKAQNEVLGATAQQHFDELKKTGTIKEVNPLLLTIFAPQNHPLLLDYNRYKPAVIIKSITIPTLIINGDADTQVTVQDAQQLHEALPGSSIAIIPKMNHVLKTVENALENQNSLFSADFPLSEELINTLVQFIKK